ncbi:MAG: hypothetical protein SCI25_00150 [Desulfuromonadales bacterium]|nr:hypothetical protein [Desulfuromonadales bacterium]
MSSWLRREVKDGLQALVALGLEGQPAAEVLPRTADIWLRAMQKANIGMSIETVDAPRVRAGFENLFPLLRRWPSPAQLIEQVPDRPKRQSLPPAPRSEGEEAEAKAKAALTDIYKGLEKGFTLSEQ